MLTTGGERSVGKVAQEQVKREGGQVSRVRKASHEGHRTHCPVTAQFSCVICILEQLFKEDLVNKVQGVFFNWCPPKRFLLF